MGDKIPGESMIWDIQGYNKRVQGQGDAGQQSWAGIITSFTKRQNNDISPGK